MRVDAAVGRPDHLHDRVAGRLDLRPLGDPPFADAAINKSLHGRANFIGVGVIKGLAGFDRR
jgi:hypothetical protein